MHITKDISERPEVRDLVRRALAEDVGDGDITTNALVPPERQADALILTRAPCVVAGGGVARAVFCALDARMIITQEVSDGAVADAGGTIMRLHGALRAILTAERTALNLLQRLCGIATLTREFVRRCAPYGVAVLDTRKTTPMLRVLEKYAVACGGGKNHRMGLHDMALIKDNHRRFWSEGGRCSLAEAVETVRRHAPGLPVEVEVENEEELMDALNGRPDWILLDNMPPERIRRCVALCAGRCRLEASGGLTLENVTAVAATGVNAVSIGALTHSAPASDLSLEIVA